MRDLRPRVGTACLVWFGEGLVLGRRGRGANKGKWVLPGGGVEVGEDWRVAGVREVLEETGLSVMIADAVPTYVMQIIGDRSHRICLVVSAYVVGAFDDIRPSEELVEVALFMPGEIPVAELSAPVRQCLEALGIIAVGEPAVAARATP